MPRDPRLYLADIVDLRNILVHEYSGIDDRVVWLVARHRVPILRGEAMSLLASLDR